MKREIVCGGELRKRVKCCIAGSLDATTANMIMIMITKLSQLRHSMIDDQIT